MSFIITNDDVQDILTDARYRADQSGHTELSELFRHPKFVRNAFGQLLHCSINSHYDPGAINTYTETVGEMIAPYGGEVRGECEYIINEIHFGLRAMVEPWCDRGWLYDIEAINDTNRSSDGMPVGFVLTPIIAPRVSCQYSDLIQTSALTDHMNTKSY